MATPESKTKDKIKRFLKLHKIDYWTPVPSAMGNTTGMSDFVAILKNGTWLAIEAKAEGKKSNVSANQQKFLDTININRGRGVVISCDADLCELEVSLRYHDLI